MKKLHLSLNQKLIGVTIIAFIVINLLIITSEYQAIKNENIASRMERVVNISENIKYGIISLMLQGSCDTVGSFLQHTRRSTRVEVLRLFDPESRLIQSSFVDSEAGKRLPDQSYDQYLKHNVSDPFVADEEGHTYVTRYLPIENMESCHKCHGSKDRILGVVEIKYSLTRAMISVRHVIMNQLIFFLLSILLFALLFSYIVIRLIDEPLKRMMDMINYIEQGDLSKKVAVKSDDIIGVLAGKFNNMVVKIREARDELENVHKTQMKRASQLALIGEIASGIAHEIKNPLACISGALQVIQGDLDDKNEHKPIIKEVLSQVGRLDGTVKRILEFAKPAKTQKSLVEVHDLIEEMVFFINQYAARKAIEVKLSHGEGVKAIHADGRALKQVLLNICLNGIEAMKENGVLHIATAMRLRSAAGREKEYVEIRITDTGNGISQENIALIFDPFFTTKEKGTGLGLSISMQIIEEHDGFIEIESAVGKGTTFRIGLPAPEGERMT
jgi:two-component system NtrC family sensor kinase